MLTDRKNRERLCSLEGSPASLPSLISKWPLNIHSVWNTAYNNSVLFHNALRYALSKADTSSRMYSAAPHIVILGQEKCWTVQSSSHFKFNSPIFDLHSLPILRFSDLNQSHQNSSTGNYSTIRTWTIKLI